MIRKLRWRFIRIAMVSLAVAIVLVVSVVNMANWMSVRSELGETLSLLAANETGEDHGGKGEHLSKKNRHTRNLVGESRWFSVSYDAEGTVQAMNLRNMTDPDVQEAEALATEALQSGRDSGFLQDYLYQVLEERIIFLDCETKLTAVRTLTVISAAACLGGILLAFLFVILASRRAIESTVRNMEQQKQFITNASHELKTPLTVISTNMELQQMETPDSAWVESTKKQVSQMRHLVEELVYLSRMEEENAQLSSENIAFDSLLQEAAEPFAAMAEFQGKTMRTEVEDGLSVQGDRASLQRLVTTLLDNAVKYAAAGGEIDVIAKSEGRHIVLTIANEVEKPLTEEQCRQLFDRFYRVDPSRNKDREKGFGIGLAIARAIVEKHGGNIWAEMERENRLVLTCRL